MSVVVDKVSRIVVADAVCFCVCFWLCLRLWLWLQSVIVSMAMAAQAGVMMVPHGFCRGKEGFQGNRGDAKANCLLWYPI